jgi:GT2 family glycosyltransferase
VPAGTVDAVIATHNTRDVTLRCLRALRREPGPYPVRCILVDNASEDGTAEAVERLLPDVVVVRSRRNLGYGEAMNRGVREGDGDYVLVLNSDTLARSGAVARLARFLDDHPEVVVAGGQLLHVGSGAPQVGFAVRAFPTLGGQLALMTGLERYWTRNPVSRRQALLDFDYRRTQLIDAQPAGACLMVRRADFEAVGGFDEGFFYWFEDVDLVRRLAERGRIGYVHDAELEHVGAETFRQWSRQEVIVARYQGLLRYFGKHHAPPEVLVLRVVVGLLAALRAVPFALVNRRRARAYLRVLGLALARPEADGPGRDP